MPSGRALVLLALLLAAPLAAAQVPPRQRVCTSYGCAITDDQDQDGKMDWANVALAFLDAFTVSLNANRTNVTYQASLTTEEYEALHLEDLGGALGADAWGYANLTSQEDGGAGFNDTEANAIAYLSDHDTGEYHPLREETAYLGDSDGDGWPERRQLPLLP